MLCGWEGNRRPGGKQWQPTAGWMTYGHLRADCLYNGISSGPNARYRVRQSLYLFYTGLRIAPKYLRIARRQVIDGLHWRQKTVANC